MLEILVGSGGNLVLAWSGPGSKVVKKGSRLEGYFGTVEEEEFVTAVELITYLDLHETMPILTPLTWIKFIYDNKVLFIPNITPIESNKSWEYFYSKGIAFGEDVLLGEPLLNLLGLEKEVKQDTIHLIGDHYFKVRFPRFKDDQLYFDPDLPYRLNVEDTSEIKGTIFRVLPNYDAKTGKKAYEDLRSIVEHSSGYFTQALYPEGVAKTYSRANQDLLNSPIATSTTARWIPVLELIPDKDVPAFPDVHHTRIGTLEYTLPVNTETVAELTDPLSPVRVDLMMPDDFGILYDYQIRNTLAFQRPHVETRLIDLPILTPYQVAEPVFTDDSVFSDYHHTPVVVNHSPVNSTPFVKYEHEKGPLIVSLTSDDGQVLFDKQIRNAQQRNLNPLSDVRVKIDLTDLSPVPVRIDFSDLVESHVTHGNKDQVYRLPPMQVTERSARIHTPNRIEERVEQTLARDNKLEGRTSNTFYAPLLTSTKLFGKELAIDIIETSHTDLSKNSLAIGIQNASIPCPIHPRQVLTDQWMHVLNFELKVV